MSTFLVTAGLVWLATTATIIVLQLSDTCDAEYLFSRRGQ